jgi:hypothetical protein
LEKCKHTPKDIKSRYEDIHADLWKKQREGKLTEYSTQIIHDLKVNKFVPMEVQVFGHA